MILIKKAVRSMLQNKRAYIACIALIAIGILTYTSMGIAATKLEVSKNTYYRDNRMADVFATVKSIPESAEKSLLKTDGIEDVSLRLKQDARVVIPGNDKIITMRLVSISMDSEYPINTVSRTSENFYSQNDIVVSEDFLTSHNLKIGDSLTLIINGQEKTFNIRGTGASPEFVYIIKDANEVLPDPETFAIGFLPEQNLAAVLNKRGIYNDVVFKLKPGYTFDDVKIALEDELSKYGLTELIPRKDQPSYAMLDSEIKGDQAMSNTIPFIFVLMAIIVLYLMLRRVIEQDRMQIGTLKAFGYSNAEILGHYLIYGVITGLLGAAIGVIIGYYYSEYLMEMYNQFYKLPKVNINVSAKFVVIGLLIGIGGGIFGAYMGAKSILKLLPSDAMRPASPKAFKVDVLKYMPISKRIFTTGGYMAVRSISRNKFRSFFIVLGVMFSFGMLAFMGSYSTMIDDMLLNQYEKIQLYDVKVTLNNPTAYNLAVESFAGVNGVKSAEGFLEIPVEFKHNHRKSGIVITGISENSSLYKIYDNDKKTDLPPPKKGVIISNSLAKKLEAKKGDTLIISSPILKKDITVLVSDVVIQNLGSSCYMELKALSKLFNLSDSATSVGIKTSESKYIKEYLKDGKNVASIEDKEKTLENYKKMLGSYNYIMYVMELMAILIAFAIIYNTATINLSERNREFATLRVLGMQVNEVGGIMAFEYWILCIAGMILGVPFTMFLKQLMANAIEIDMFTLPTYTPIPAYITAALGCMLAVFLSNRSSLRKIRKFDMVEVLKERE